MLVIQRSNSIYIRKRIMAQVGIPIDGKKLKKLIQISAIEHGEYFTHFCKSTLWISVFGIYKAEKDNRIGYKTKMHLDLFYDEDPKYKSIYITKKE